MFRVISFTDIGIITIADHFRTHRDACNFIHDNGGRLHSRFGLVLHVSIDRTDFVDDFHHVSNLLKGR